MKYLKVENPNNFYYIDIETNGLSHTRIWCVVILNKGTRQVWRFHGDTPTLYHDIQRFFIDQKNAVWCAHNGLSFDGPVLADYCGMEFKPSDWVDTLVLSYLYNPALDGGHSLEAYGEKLKFPKVEHTDWTCFSPEMLNRCETDVYLLEKVHDALLMKMNRIGFSEMSCWIEHEIRVIIDEQEQNGFWFNTVAANELLQHLRQLGETLADSIHKLFPPRLESVKFYSSRWKKDGSLTKRYLECLNSDLIITDYENGSFETSRYESFNIASSKQRLERLLELGYEPTAKTKKGNPKIDEDSLLAYAKLSGRPEITAMAEWLTTFGQGNMIQTWLDCVGGDSRIHGQVFSCGATTRRMRHRKPNTANIPSGAKASYGEECRALWGVEPGKGLKLVGYDAAGLETVGLCHYLGNPKATAVLLQPKPNDIHTMNSRLLTELLQRPIDREWGAKTSWYAWLYGAYPPKLGSIVKGPPSDGELIIKTFFKNVPGLERLINNTHDEWSGNKGLLRCIDGGYVRCPGINASLNYRIQSLGAIIMKLTAIRLDKTAKKEGFEFKKVGDIHDEGQLETGEKETSEVGKIAVQSITEAGEILKVRERVTGDFKVGDNWSQTH